MKLFTNKRGEGDTHIFISEVLFYILIIMAIGLMFIVLIGKGSTLLDARAAVSRGLDEDIRIARFTNVCASYQEDGRIYQNVIDLSKVTQKNLENCFEGTFYVTIQSVDSAFDPVFLRHGRSTPQEEFTRYVLVAQDGGFYPAELVVRI